MSVPNFESIAHLLTRDKNSDKKNANERGILFGVEIFGM